MPDLGTARLELEADVSGFDKGIDHAKAKVQGLGKTVQQTGATTATGMNTAGAATAGLTKNVQGATVSVSQLAQVSRGGLSGVTAAFAGASFGAGNLTMALKGVAVASIGFFAASKFLGFMREHSESTAAAMERLEGRTDALADRVAGDLAPAVDSAIDGLTGLVAGAENAYDALTKVARTWKIVIEATVPGGTEGTFWDALGFTSKNALKALPGGSLLFALDEASGDTDDLARSTKGWLDGIQAVMKRYGEIRASAVAIRANADVGPRGGVLPTTLPVVWGEIPPPTWIGTVKGVYASLADFVAGVMQEALYPSQAVLTTAEQAVERAKVTLTQLEARRRDEGGLSDYWEGVWEAQKGILTEQIGPGAAEEFVSALVNNAGLITGVLGDAAFTAGMQMLAGATAAFQYANTARVLADESNLPDGEQFKRGMEQVGSAEPLYPGVLEDITNVGILDTGLSSLPTPSIAPVVNIGPALAAIATLRYALLSISNITPAGPGGERGGSTSGITPSGFNPRTLTMLPSGGSAVHAPLALPGARGSEPATRMLGGGTRGPLIQQTIVGLTPEDVTRQTRRAFRQLAVEFGGAG